MRPRPTPRVRRPVLVTGLLLAACAQGGGTGPVQPLDPVADDVPIRRSATLRDEPIETRVQGAWTYRRTASTPATKDGGRAEGKLAVAGGAAPAPSAPPAEKPASGGEVAYDWLEADGPVLARRRASAEKAKADPGLRLGDAPTDAIRDVAHPLRAGTTDDNADLAAFTRFLAEWPQRKDVAGRWQPIDVRDRKFVRVVDAAGRPVPAARVTVLDEARDRTVGHATTYGDGRAPVYPRLGADPDAATTGAEAAAATADWIVDVRAGDVARRVRWDGSGGEFTVTLGATPASPDPVPIDVAFLIDTTGSMGDEIASIQACLLRVTEKIRGLARETDLRIGTVLYRDVGDEYLTATHPLTSDVGALDAALRSVRADGGGDGPESLNQGLLETVDGLAWRDGAAKVAFLVADAPPHMDYAGDTPYGVAMQAAVGKGLRVHTVAASGLDAVGTLVFRQIAQFTRGKFVFLQYGSIADSAASHGVAQVEKNDNLEDILFEQIRDEVAFWGR